MSNDWPMTPSIGYICKGGRYVKNMAGSHS